MPATAIRRRPGTLKGNKKSPTVNKAGRESPQSTKNITARELRQKKKKEEEKLGETVADADLTRCKKPKKSRIELHKNLTSMPPHSQRKQAGPSRWHS